jgi:hypothetical protein
MNRHRFAFRPAGARDAQKTPRNDCDSRELRTTIDGAGARTQGLAVTPSGFE